MRRRFGLQCAAWVAVYSQPCCVERLLSFPARNPGIRKKPLTRASFLSRPVFLVHTRNAYRSVRDARDWQNPYLMVGREGIYARPISAATEAPTMRPADVVAYLEKLPSIAWPYGLVVAVSENGVRAPGDDAPIERNREELIRLLQEEGIKVELWPSA